MHVPCRATMSPPVALWRLTKRTSTHSPSEGGFVIERLLFSSRRAGQPTSTPRRRTRVTRCRRKSPSRRSKPPTTHRVACAAFLLRGVRFGRHVSAEIVPILRIDRLQRHHRCNPPRGDGDRGGRHRPELRGDGDLLRGRRQRRNRPNGTATVASADSDCADAGEAVAADPIGDCNDTNVPTFPGPAPNDSVTEGRRQRQLRRFQPPGGCDRRNRWQRHQPQRAHGLLLTAERAVVAADNARREGGSCRR